MIGNDHVRFGPGAAGKGPARRAGTSPAAYRNGGSSSPPMSSHPPTRAYVERRTGEGKSKTKIIRCLKRYVAREIYPQLRAAAD